MSPPAYPYESGQAPPPLNRTGALDLWARLERVHEENLARVITTVAPSVGVAAAGLDDDPTAIFSTFYRVGGRNSALVKMRDERDELTALTEAVVEGREIPVGAFKGIDAAISELYRKAMEKNAPSLGKTDLPPDLAEVRDRELSAGKAEVFTEVLGVVRAGQALCVAGDQEGLVAWAESTQEMLAAHRSFEKQMERTTDSAHLWLENRTARRSLEHVLVEMRDRNRAQFGPVTAQLPTARLSRLPEGPQRTQCLIYVEEAMVTRDLLGITDRASVLGPQPNFEVPKGVVVSRYDHGDVTPTEQVLVIPADEQGNAPSAETIQRVQTWASRQSKLERLQAELPTVNELVVDRTVSNSPAHSLG